MYFRAALLVCLVATSCAFGQGRVPSSKDKDSIRPENLVMKEGIITGLQRLKSGKIEMKFQEDGKSESEAYTIDWRTMVYKLTERNRKIFKEQDKLEYICSDINKLHKRQNELPEKERKLLSSMWATVYVHPGHIYGSIHRSRTGVLSGHISSYSPGSVTVHSGYSRAAADKLIEAQEGYKREEEERRSNYGAPVKLVASMTAYLIADKASDRTYAILVTGKLETPKEKAQPELTSPGDQKENQSNAKLRLARGLVEDARAAVNGKEKQRLWFNAKSRLEDIIKNYPGTPAAQEAKDLLKKGLDD
jgi:hypothetical protein